LIFPVDSIGPPVQQLRVIRETGGTNNLLLFERPLLPNGEVWS
jgi:hypothetical protein